MGDHRASIKIEFSMHGIEDEQEWYINWSPEEYGGVDRRIIEWLEEKSQDAMDKFEAEAYAAGAEQRAKDEERAERAELARLTAKYGSLA